MDLVTAPWQLHAIASSGQTFTDGTVGSVNVRFYRTSRANTAAGANFTSANIVGFVRRQMVAPGDNFISNPLHNANHTVANLFANAEDGTQLYRFDETAQAYIANTRTFGTWDNPNMILPPGEGLIVRVPRAITFTFVGEALEGELRQIIPGAPVGTTQLRLRSSIAARTGLIQTHLNLSGLDGEQIYVWNPATQSFTTSTWDVLSTPPRWFPTEPTIELGTCFWLRKVSRFQTDWRQSFWVPRRP